MPTDPSTSAAVCHHCGDHTDPDDDPAPDLCAMCAKAGRTGSAADETPDQATLDSINAVVENARPDEDFGSGPASDTDACEKGICAVCEQEMLRTADDCWHPYYVTRACPPEHNVNGVTLPEWGRTGRPGREHFRAV